MITKRIVYEIIAETEVVAEWAKGILPDILEYGHITSPSAYGTYIVKMEAEGGQKIEL